MDNKLALTNATVYLYKGGVHEPTQTNVLIDNGIIKQITPNAHSSGYKKINLKGLHIIPGGYDTHCHGGGSLTSPTEGLYSPGSEKFLYSEENARAAFEIALREHVKHGTTSMNLSAMAIPTDRLNNFLRLSGKYSQNQIPNGANFIGADLEGPYAFDADDRGYTGAQNPLYFIKPDIDQFQRFQELANGSIIRAMIGLERDQIDTAKPALNLAKYLASQGIPIGLGHSGAREEVIRDAMNLGGKLVYVHLGNGLNKINVRQDQARLFESLAETVNLADKLSTDLYAELILDGVHLDSRFDLWAATYMFGKEKIIAVTDNIGLTGDPPADRFMIAGTPAIISPENPNAIWVENAVGEKLCGSKATMDQLLSTYIGILMQGGLPYFLKYKVDPKPFDEAMDWALHATSTNPARLYGRDQIGSIELGKQADLVALDISKEPLELKVEKVWVKGKEIIS